MTDTKRFWIKFSNNDDPRSVVKGPYDSIVLDSTDGNSVLATFDEIETKDLATFHHNTWWWDGERIGDFVEVMDHQC